jgi:class 3 adenylate cyclase
MVPERLKLTADREHGGGLESKGREVAERDPREVRPWSGALKLAALNRHLQERVHDQQQELDRLNRLRQFVSPQVVDTILSDPSGELPPSHRRDVVVVFFDLRGYTTFAQTSEPEAVMRLLRQYHGEIGRLAAHYAGTIERFTGDGIMIFFNDPVPRADAAERAVRMSLAVRERFGEIAATWRRQGHDLALGVGISSGFATVGPIGFEGRYDYAAIGTVTNLAARLCGEAKPNQILACQRVVGSLEDVLEVESVADLVLRGFLCPTRVYNILGLQPSFSSADGASVNAHARDARVGTHA